MSNEKCISKLGESNLLDGCQWISSVCYSKGKKIESLFIYDELFPEAELAENLLDMAEDILGKEKFHNLLMSCL